MTKTSISLQELRKRIYAKAKAEKAWRFWGLHVHVCKEETLREAYRLVKANRGAPGIDGATFATIEAGGLDAFLEQLRGELISGAYRPMRNREKAIPKGDGRFRILGIPTGVAYCTCHSLPWGCPDDTTRIRVYWRTLSRNSASLSGSIDIQCGEPRLSFRAWIMPRSIQ